MKIKLIFLTVFIIIAFIGCKKQETEISPDIANNDEALYQMGERFIKKDSEKARLYFRQIIDSFPKSFYAQRAKLAIADSYFDKGDEGSMIIAASEYREFISLFPYSPSAPYAQLQIALSFYKKILKPGRDQTKTQQALVEFKRVVTKFPLSEEAKVAREKILECEDKLAEHSLAIAEHYYRVKAYKAAINRLTEVLTEYPSFSQMDKAYYFLADAYISANLIDQGTPYFRKLISDYPSSKYAIKAKAKMDEIEAIQKKIEKIGD